MTSPIKTWRTDEPPKDGTEILAQWLNVTTGEVMRTAVTSKAALRQWWQFHSGIMIKRAPDRWIPIPGPHDVIVTVPEPIGEGGYCSEDCPFYWEQCAVGSDDYIQKPGPGCPRYLGESK